VLHSFATEHGEEAARDEFAGFVGFTAFLDFDVCGFAFGDGVGDGVHGFVFDGVPFFGEVGGLRVDFLESG
jgi:hypothetical protein